MQIEHTFSITDNGKQVAHLSKAMYIGGNAVVYKWHKTDFNRPLE